ncbi:uncharacterized protein N0V89_010861 [Didymosphaeria variabile]|uniref:MFS general substrate transporter n=1 Tax=Didymosphaeria variabile TaxID=1932322 RepID=A0A9W9C6Z3_9PLEO|nr:uncharacterized protein N0V89_010861 [Didymosphaeria variabile]KAJ4346928.1 hypothetical protein N0V89_010861 [Didymosphaeria variabile]
MLNGLNILPSYTDYFNLNPATTGLNTGSVFIGGFFGPMVSGIMSDRLGRRPTIFWGCLLTIVGIIIQTAAQNIAMFVVARIILGFGSIVAESPRWLVHEGFYEEARTVVAQTNADGDPSSPIVLTVYKEILDTLEWEKKEGRTMSPQEIFKTPVARKRLLIGASAGPFSCVAGNIIASYYLGSELNTAGITNSNDQLKATYADHPEGASKSLIYGDVAVMFLFQGFYSIAWTPLLYLYPPEVMNYSIRANGVAFSQFALNAFACVLVFVMPIGLENIGWKMYMINGSWDIAIIVLIAVYWVETKGKTLEEIDAIFEGEKHSAVPDVEAVRKGEATVNTKELEQDLNMESMIKVEKSN